MKGKYANAAEKRRGMETLEQRAANAERERDRLTAELATQAARHQRSRAEFRAKLAEVERQRDEGAAPALAATREAMGELKAKADSLRKANAKMTRTNRRLLRVIVTAGIEAGFTEKDAGGAAYGLVDPEEAEAIAMQNDVKLGPQTVRFTNIRDRANGFDVVLSDALAGFYNAMATGAWRLAGTDLILEKWATWAQDAREALALNGEPDLERP
jgi:NADH dehydrogenase/NADH:ubiquinone oxidoreductase subunit G